MIKMNVRRWHFRFVDEDGVKRQDWIKARSKKHARDIIASRCKNKPEITSVMSSTEKTTYLRPFGKISLAIWESLTTPISLEMMH